jgi:hypothetical protein
MTGRAYAEELVGQDMSEEGNIVAKEGSSIHQEENT